LFEFINFYLCLIIFIMMVIIIIIIIIIIILMMIIINIIILLVLNTRNFAKFRFVTLDIARKNSLYWILNVEIHLRYNGYWDTIK